MRFLSLRLRLILAGMLALVPLFTAARLGFLAGFGPSGAIHDALTWKAMWLGLRMDARLAALCLFPALVLLREGGAESPRWKAVAAPWSLLLNLGLCVTLLVVANIDDQAAKPWAIGFLLGSVADWTLFRRQGLGLPAVRRVWCCFLLALLAGLALCYAADAGSYAYIHTRLNGSLLQFLENPWLSAKMAWETYPVLPIALGVGLMLAFGCWIVKRLWQGLGAAPSPDRPARILQGAVATLGMLFLIWGRLNGYPLRWGDAYSLGQSFQAHLALNPVLFLLETAKDPSEGYDLAEVRATGPVLAKYLGCEYQEVKGEPRLWRVQEPHPLVPAGAKPNVVFIHLESFAAPKTGTFGNPLDPTPRFDALAKEGLLFDHFYAPAENTSRAMFAVLFGTADMSPGGRNSATRNPLLVDQRSLLNDLEGYSRHYYLGGTGDWAQIRAALKNNVHGLDVKEEDAFKGPKVDVWGVTDADFLHECDGFLGQAQEPFFALVQTAGNHPPFTIPAHLNFPLAHPAKEAIAGAGFAGEDEFNALRLMDWSLGRFFDEARTKPWFRNTVFVLYGDHGVPRGRFDTRFGDLALISHHVPLLIYAPGLIRPGRAGATASLMDVVPTVMSLLGRRVELHTLGRDALDPRFKDSGTAFTFTPFVTPPSYGLLRGERYLTISSGGQASLFDLQDAAGTDLSKQHPDETRELAQLARATRAWSRYLLSHNKP